MGKGFIVIAIVTMLNASLSFAQEYDTTAPDLPLSFRIEKTRWEYGRRGANTRLSSLCACTRPGVRSDPA